MDNEILLYLNHCHNALLDEVMLKLSDTWTWLPLLLATIFVVLKDRPLREGIAILVGIGLCVLLADQISASIIKPWVARLRPTHHPDLMFQVRCIAGRGGLYGFVSSHASNAFAITVFCAMVFRHGLTSSVLLLYASAVSISRVYLGKHYPSDILAGAALGAAVGLVLYGLLRLLQSRVMSSPSQYYSSAYTSSGFLLSDMRIILSAMALTLLYVLF